MQTLTATTFPLAEAMQIESVTETANANATIGLTYDYTPAPEPGTVALSALGILVILIPGLLLRRGRDLPMRRRNLLL